jgi:hypothetical protein
MKIYICDYPHSANKWIYKGYRNAWKKLGYEVVLIPGDKLLSEVFEDCGEEYMAMIPDFSVSGEDTGDRCLEILEKSYKTFVSAQPNAFPAPWGHHLNFKCGASASAITALNQMDNVFLWAFADDDFGSSGSQFGWRKWKKVNTIPLAYDSVAYQEIKDDKYKEFDISFIGGWVNNGFNEKRKIMTDIFSKFMKSGLKCGFFIEKNLTHEQECKLLYNSKMTLNIHDAYQRTLGCDTNERTFKSLGLNGCLVSDTVGQLNRIFPNLRTSLDPDEIVQITKDYLSLSEKELNDIKEENRQNILENHTYINRVKAMLSFKNS